MIITISGTPGSGKSTVAKILAKELGAERIYVGEIRRELARQKGMTLQELNGYALTHPETDVDVDKDVAQRARMLENKKKKDENRKEEEKREKGKKKEKEKIVLVEGRTQFHFLPESVKIYLKVSVDEAARRIWNDLQQEEKKKERNEGNFNSLAQVKKEILAREENDVQRYKKYYGIDHRDEKQYDLIVDSTHQTPEEVVQKIMVFLRNNAKV